MKITILGPAHPFRGGIATYNERMAQEFQAHGHEVDIKTFTVQYPNFLFPGKSQFTESEKPADLKIERCVNSVNPFNWLKVGNQIKKDAPDLLIVRYWLPFMGPCLGTILRRVRKNRKTKIVCLVDNIIPHEKRIGDRMFTNYFVKPIDGFVAMSKSVFDDIDQFKKTDLKVLTPHPLFDNFGENISRKEALSRLNLSSEFRYILFFGLIRKYKGLDLLLEAMKDSFFKENNIKLIVAGEYYSDKQNYQQFIQENGLEDQIIELDKFIPDDEVNAVFGASDLVVQPYKTATQSGVTQIAYHFEKPMVVTNVGGLPELCPDGKVGYVVNTDPTEISEVIQRFFEENKAEEMKANIQQEKKKFQWDILVEKMIDLASRIEK